MGSVEPSFSTPSPSPLPFAHCLFFFFFMFFLFEPKGLRLTDTDLRGESKESGSTDSIKLPKPLDMPTRSKVPVRDDDWKCTLHQSHKLDFYICYHASDLAAAEALMAAFSAAGMKAFLDRACLQHLYIANKGEPSMGNMLKRKDCQKEKGKKANKFLTQSVPGFRKSASAARLQGLYASSAAVVLISPVSNQTLKLSTIESYAQTGNQ